LTEKRLIGAQLGAAVVSQAPLKRHLHRISRHRLANRLMRFTPSLPSSSAHFDASYSLRHLPVNRDICMKRICIDWCLIEGVRVEAFQRINGSS
jgi:hypothetical protein